MRLKEQSAENERNGERLPDPVRLDKWSRCTCQNIVARGPHLRGIVYGHPEIPDGELVHTSPIVWIAGDRAQTLSRLYALPREGS